MRPLAAFLAIACAACVDGGATSACDQAVVGDPDQSPLLEIVTRDDAGLRTLADGDDVPLILAPQGGFVLLAGARARNLAAGAVQLTGWLRDPSSDRVLGLESRPSELVELADGWASMARPEIFGTFSNISACPSADLEHDVHDQPWLLSLRVEDCAGRSVESQVRVTPRCPLEYADVCTCECDTDYLLGGVCD
jgi:hypothetical protein